MTWVFFPRSLFYFLFYIHSNFTKVPNGIEGRTEIIKLKKITPYLYLLCNFGFPYLKRHDLTLSDFKDLVCSSQGSTGDRRTTLKRE